MSVTFVTPNEMGYLRVIEDLTKRKMSPLRPPTQQEAIQGQLGIAVNTIQDELQKNGLDHYQKQPQIY